MRNLLLGLLLVAFACSLQACTAKGSNLVPLVSQQQQLKPMDGTGGGPARGGPVRNCPESGCPGPTPTP